MADSRGTAQIAYCRRLGSGEGVKKRVVMVANVMTKDGPSRTFAALKWRKTQILAHRSERPLVGVVSQRAGGDPLLGSTGSGPGSKLGFV